MDDDFATPEAVAVLFELAAEVNRTRSVALATQLKALGRVLGVLHQHPATYLQAGKGLDESSIMLQIEARQQAKLGKDFALADQIRKNLLANGVQLKDSAQGTTWERV
jgi:cysteinyl-tRNA synthetase